MVLFDMDFPKKCRNCKFIGWNGIDYICEASSRRPIYNDTQDADFEPLDIRQEWCPIKGEVESIKNKMVEAKLHLQIY